MPYCHLERQTRAAAHEIKHEVKRTGGSNLRQREILEILGRHDVEHLGDGACVFVSAQSLPGGGEIAVALDYTETSVPRAKVIFYTHRLLSILFPHNFPRFLAARGKLPDEDVATTLSGTLREMVRAKTNHYSFRTLDMQGFRFSFMKALSIMSQLNLPFELPDTFSGNFAPSQDRSSVLYVDTIRITRGQFDLGKIISYMVENGYNHKDRHAVRQCIKRLEFLRKNLTDNEFGATEHQIDHIDLNSAAFC